MNLKDSPDRERIFALFADVLDYPMPGVSEKAAECEKLLRKVSPDAAAAFQGFRGYVGENSIERLEEIYSGFFDLNPICHPYVGYQLFGENYKRSSFLLGLQERYNAKGYLYSASEIADRLSLILRFISLGGDSETDELVREGLLPALERMITHRESSHDHHDHPGDFDGDTGVERKQLDGHSHGEVLAGGFLLELTTDEDGPAGENGRPHPYHQALQALHIALSAGWPTNGESRNGEP